MTKAEILKKRGEWIEVEASTVPMLEALLQEPDEDKPIFVGPKRPPTRPPLKPSEMRELKCRLCGGVVYAGFMDFPMLDAHPNAIPLDAECYEALTEGA